VQRKDTFLRLERDPRRQKPLETGSYVRLIDFVYHSTLGLIVIKKKRRNLSKLGADFGLDFGVDRDLVEGD